MLAGCRVHPSRDAVFDAFAATGVPLTIGGPGGTIQYTPPDFNGPANKRAGDLRTEYVAYQHLRQINGPVDERTNKRNDITHEIFVIVKNYHQATTDDVFE